MIWISFLANLGVLAAVLVGLWRDAPALVRLLGPDSPARRLLAALFATLVCASLAAFAFPDKAAEIAHTLFPLQILGSLFVLGFLGLRSAPAQVSTGLAALHLVTMVTLYT